MASEGQGMSKDETTQRTKVTRGGDVVIGGRYVASVIRERGWAPPAWALMHSGGAVTSWHYSRRDAVAEAERMHGNA